jgi:hypothetical protein
MIEHPHDGARCDDLIALRDAAERRQASAEAALETTRDALVKARAQAANWRAKYLAAAERCRKLEQLNLFE